MASAAAVVPAFVAAAPAAAGVLSVSPTGSIKAYLRGNGHGHGMSQYGARGAAIAGRSYQQIAAFYYPGTTLTTIPATWIRVRVSGAGSTTSVAAYSELTVSGVSGWLPTSGVSRYRLIADATSGTTLQQLKSATGSTWQNYRTGLANGAYFHRSNNYSIRLFLSDATSIRYFGILRAYRGDTTGTTGGVYTVNRVTIDDYTAGVVPREMPSSWQRAAVDAQAVAARTYGMYAVEHPQRSVYDICDTTQCQVYGGYIKYDQAGNVLWTDAPQPVADTSNQVLRYGGKTIFAEFAASNGGWSVDGGQPYLKAQADPYDAAPSGDPYLLYSKVVTVASLARYYGLAKLTRITISVRDGNGDWGGRAVAGYLDGTDSVGAAQRVYTTGFELQDALGVGTTWMHLTTYT